MPSQSPRRRLPIGIQNLREIREGGYYYVDKTPFALRLAGQGKYFFLSRPRRFGKSLFLDTLAELFGGNRALFTGLHAEANWNWERRHPVLRLSFGEGVPRSRDELRATINRNLADHEERLGLPPRFPDFSSRFFDLVRRAAEQAGERAVVLVDEYDKPILDNIENPDAAVEMREELKNLYSVIKGADPHLRFVLLTGVSKFSKVSLFSGLNNLQDISLDERYSAVCGYTEQDVDTVFAPELEGLDRGQIRDWYNGYNWLGESVYNPFDLLLLFDRRQFASYWYETGSPTFLLKLLRQRAEFLPDLSGRVASPVLLSTFDVGNIPTAALMFQAGYLTIGEEIREEDNVFYRLRYPNREVYKSLNENLLFDWLPPQAAPSEPRSRLLPLLRAGDLAGAGDLMKAFFASIPHQWHIHNEIARYEGYYASVFYAFFASLGLEIAVEESSNAGRLDMAVKFAGRTILFEFKLVEDAPEGTALRQMRERGYAEKHRAGSGPIHLVGVEFSKARRAIVAWEVEVG